MRILFTGGGTGGHLYPILSLARTLLHEDASGDCISPIGQAATVDPHRGVVTPPGRSRTHAVLFVGARGNMDQQLLERDAIPYVTIDSKPLGRKTLFESAGSIAANTAATVRAVPIVKNFKPDVIVGGGGYACAAAVLAGALLRRMNILPQLKIVLLEPNLQPGYANRRLARLADEVWGAYPESSTSRHFKEKFRLTGVPVRRELYTAMSKADARRSLGLDPDRFTILTFGGSQGARSLNVAVSGMAARRRLPENWQILHVTGVRDFEWMSAERKTDSNANHYKMLPYLDSMPLAYWAADLVVCRSGASTLAELCTVGLPCILVPYPHAAEDHQRANADYLVDHGAALTIQDALLTPDSLYWLLMDTAEPDKLAAMHKALLRLAHPLAVNAMVERLLSGRIGAAENNAA
ncbi:MAG: UDP-N-acetylglucosamine--N-acetylmuramyl-(pentapeptide) pyrophosphoryl-undecaprenol N-acetylglucosamine transferase [Candidatus Eremiobacteraeota bacterium]|nr:UDP-N-acetylglucosamine--N-acetylmuramyl-(pentapeptide) pyrophosphoryl-undecaprenol N-acetylglucosamine transferase [Candidatus Eremiobacteraeota bacterium]